MENMALFDLPLASLQAYRPELSEPTDFDQFWQATLQETRAYPLNVRFESADFALTLVDTFDVTFCGFGGQDIKGWLILPSARPGPLPCVVQFFGYGGGRGLPTDLLTFACAGYAHLAMDTRGQGSQTRKGDTPDLLPTELQDLASGPHYPGFLTRGIRNPHAYYYRRVFSDAVRAIEAAKAHPAVDASRIALSGGSQGGGIALAAAGLVPDVQAVLPDVPFLCHYRRATELVETFPYAELLGYLRIHQDQVETVFATLAYFDGVHFAARARAEALFSVGLMDNICPPSTVYAAYNVYAGKKEIRIYPYNGHEGGQNLHLQEKLRFLRALWP